jgi:hypothetical protein
MWYSQHFHASTTLAGLHHQRPLSDTTYSFVMTTRLRTQKFDTFLSQLRTPHPGPVAIPITLCCMWYSQHFHASTTLAGLHHQRPLSDTTYSYVMTTRLRTQKFDTFLSQLRTPHPGPVAIPITLCCMWYAQPFLCDHYTGRFIPPAPFERH